MPSARSACNGRAGDCSTLVVVVGFFLLLRAPHPLHCSHRTQVRPSRAPVSLILAHLGALDRHHDANMSQHSLKMTPRCNKKAILETTSPKTAPKMPQPPLPSTPKVAKTEENLTFFNVFHSPDMVTNQPKMLPESPQKLPS